MPDRWIPYLVAFKAIAEGDASVASDIANAAVVEGRLAGRGDIILPRADASRLFEMANHAYKMSRGRWYGSDGTLLDRTRDVLEAPDA